MKEQSESSSTLSNGLNHSDKHELCGKWKIL